MSQSAISAITRQLSYRTHISKQPPPIRSSLISLGRRNGNMANNTGRSCVLGHQELRGSVTMLGFHWKSRLPLVDALCLYLDRHRTKYRGNLRLGPLFSEGFRFALTHRFLSIPPSRRLACSLSRSTYPCFEVREFHFRRPYPDRR
jgi:hypothetical protein